MTRLDDDRMRDLTELLSALSGRFTEFVELMRSLGINQVLGTETLQIPAEGVAFRDWSVPMAAVKVANLGSASVTVAASSAQDRAPTTGVGVFVVPGGTTQVVNLTGTSLSIYGRAGQRVSLEVYAKPQPPMGSATGMESAGATTQFDDIAVDATAGGVVLLAPNPARRGATIENTGGANMRVTVDGSTPSPTHGIQLAAGQVLTLSAPDVPTAAVRAIREGATSTTAAAAEVA